MVLIGRLTRDPELKYTQNGTAYATFSLAVDRRKDKNGERKADFIPCVAWSKLGEVVANNLAKGRRIGIEGRLQTGSYEAQDGTRRNTFDVVVNELEFLDGAKKAASQEEAGGFGPPVPDDDIPF